jgi:hypothetical protein
MRNSVVFGFARCFLLGGCLIATGLLTGCGGAGMQTTTPSTGSITTLLSDPPTCAAPGGQFQNAWVTITKATANISSSAADTDSGWVTLADLTANPKQIDLLSLASTTCVLTQLGSATGLPPGNYQQIRLYLLDNNASSGPTPNNCGSGNGFNCVIPTGAPPQELQLSSEAQTGLKIPPGQIAGGGVSITAGQSADLIIDFDACASILQEGNGKFRLKPTLRAGETGINSNSISGSVVDNANRRPVAGAVVLLEQPDANNIDRVVRAGMTDTGGNFVFCPLPIGSYDVVVAAYTTTATLLSTTYNATITFNVPLGTALQTIPLIPEATSGFTSIPATITGQVTSTGSGGATVADITISALQQATPIGGSSPVQVAVPVFLSPSQPPVVATAPCPVSVDCSNFTLQVPASNPEVGTFTGGAVTYATPAAGPVMYSINGTTPDCTGSSPSSATVGPVAVTAGNTTPMASILAFAGCTAPQ